MNEHIDELLESVREETRPTLDTRTEEEFLQAVGFGIKAKRQRRMVGLMAVVCAVGLWGYHAASESNAPFGKDVLNVAVAPAANPSDDGLNTSDRNADYLDAAHDFWLTLREGMELDTDIFGPEDDDTEFELLADMPAHLGAIAELCFYN